MEPIKNEPQQNQEDEKFFDEMEKRINAQFEVFFLFQNLQKAQKSTPKKIPQKITMKLIQKRSFPAGSLKKLSQTEMYFIR